MLEGAKVVVADVSDDAGRALADELGEAAVFAHLDVRDEAQWQAVVAETVARWGRVDVLVNNPGFYKTRSIEKETLEHFMLSVDVNQIGPFLGIKSVVATMTAAGEGRSSTSPARQVSRVPIAGSPTTPRSSRSVASRRPAVELAPVGIRVNTVLPGIIETPPTARIPAESRAAMEAATPLGRWGRADEAANLVLFLASDESSFCTGGDYFVDGGATA